MNELMRAKQEKRFRILKRVYDLTDGNSTAMIDANELPQNVRLNDDEIDAVIDYLCNEGLMDRPAIGGYIAITHMGVKEVEDFLSNPERGTEHFKHANVTNNFYGSVGVAQTGVNNATVTMGQADAIETVLILLTQLKNMTGQISPQHQDEFEAELDDVEAEVKNPTKKANWLAKVTRGLESAKSLGAGVVGVVDVIDQVREAITNLVP